jgi:transglutaminase-like putative cysteine protease
MKKILLLFLSCSFFVQTINAQKGAEPNADDISQAVALKEKFDKDDVIAITQSTETINFSINEKENKVVVHRKIEDYLINLDNRADIQKYYFYDGQSKIKTFQIYYKTNKKTHFYIEDKAYTNHGLFHNDSRVKYIEIDFPLKGYKYKSLLEEQIDDIKYFTSVYFDDEFPIEQKKITIKVPNWLDLELKEINFDGYNIKHKVESKSDLKIHTYTLNDIPARVDEKQAPGPTYIYPHILILSKSFTNNSKKNILFNETKDLYNWYHSLVRELKNDNTAFKSLVTDLTKDAKTDKEKIKKIFYWVQDNIRYIAFEDGIAGFKPDEASNVYNKKYGDCKGMANLTKQMLKEANFDSRLVWIGTKRIAYNYSTPNLSVDNHMICAVDVDGETIFLDGTEKYNPFGEYAFRIQNKEALIENGEDYILKKVPNTNVAFNKEELQYNFKLEGEELKGTVVKKYNGERRTELLYHLNNTKNDKREETLKRFLNRDNINIVVDHIKTSDLNNREVALIMEYDLIIKNAVSSFDNEYYIDIDFDKEFSSFKFDKRKLDYVFSSKKWIVSTTTLEIPKNYTITSLPKNIELVNNDFKLKVTFSKNGNIITYQKEFLIKNAIIKKVNFNQWNSFIDKLVNLYNEQLILIKK